MSKMNLGKSIGLIDIFFIFMLPGLLIAAHASSASSKRLCRLPAGDNQSASPPSLEGTVISKDMGKKTFIVETTKGKYRVLVSKFNERSVFTNYGGTVTFDEIKAGDFVRVWSKNCASPKKGKLDAEAMIINR